MFGWLSTPLPAYTPDTLNLETMVHTREVGVRPLVVLEPTEHSLAVEQRTGITVAELEGGVSQLLHATCRPGPSRARHAARRRPPEVARLG